MCSGWGPETALRRSKKLVAIIADDAIAIRRYVGVIYDRLDGGPYRFKRMALMLQNMQHLGLRLTIPMQYLDRHLHLEYSPLLTPTYPLLPRTGGASSKFQ